MTKKRYVVRVVQTVEPSGRMVSEGGYIDPGFIESLRYAGLIQQHATDPRGLTHHCFDLLPPAGVDDTQGWAERNAERMQTFGFNAVAAPEAPESVEDSPPRKCRKSHNPLAGRWHEEGIQQRNLED